MNWYKRGNLLLAALAVLTGIIAVVTKPQLVPANTEMKRWHAGAEGLQYLDDSGEPVRSGWREVYGVERYFDYRGILAVGDWQEVMGDWYYLDEKGEKVVGWVSDEGRYYLDPDGKMLTGWARVEGHT
ncbi:MAG TPA: hypothetical protein IAC62_11115, partial [Candidatus Pelethocola excrementipullorum]|nr:hypothetical protein [Candidatus Pelethocola excrementipullorum]